MQALAVSLYGLPDWLEVRSLTLQSSAGEQAVALPLGANATLLPLDEPFTLQIDVAPAW